MRRGTLYWTLATVWVGWGGVGPGFSTQPSPFHPGPVGVWDQREAAPVRLHAGVLEDIRAGRAAPASWQAGAPPGNRAPRLPKSPHPAKGVVIGSPVDGERAGAVLPLGSPPQSLEEAARLLADAWSRGDAPLLESLMKGDGLRLQLLQEDHRSVSARRGRAALQEFFQRFPGGRADLVRVSAAGPESAKGSAEYRLVVPQPGAPLHLTLFVGFERGERGWLVTEFRILR